MLTVFAAALSACGLDYGQAAKALGLSRSTIQKKCSLNEEGLPVLPMTASDAAKLRRLHEKIRLGDVEGEEQSIRYAAAALRILRGLDTPVDKPTGRPAKPKEPVPPPPPEKPESVRMLENWIADYLEGNESQNPSWRSRRELRKPRIQLEPADPA